jgi:glycosyltransferase involved in cell wall biosynthesis
MFLFPRVPPVTFVPWTADLEQRLLALSTRPRHIAYFYPQPDTTTFRYRALNMVNALSAMAEGETSASWFCNLDLRFMDRFIERADALVICRAPYTRDLDQLIAKAKARDISVFFDIDDFAFDPSHVPSVMEIADLDATSEELLDRSFAYFSRIGTTLQMCDRALTTNSFLAEQIRHFAPHLYVDIVPNFLNVNQQRLSEQLYAAKQQVGFVSDGCIHIGYFSGSPSHNRDFALVVPALTRLMDQDTRLKWRVVGVLENFGLLASHRDRIECYPLQDFQNLQRLIAEVEINLAPLQDNIFTNCKSELKYFEAAIVGSITVASPTHAFRNAIVDGETSFLARSYEWEYKLREALNLVGEPKRYAAMAQCAHRHVEEAYGWNKHGAAIERIIFEKKTENIHTAGSPHSF